MGFNFDEKKALKAGSPAFIQEGGVYQGKITKALLKKSNSGAVFVEISITNDDGMECRTSIYTKNKDGAENFGVNHIHSLMGFNGFQTLKETAHNEDGVQCYILDALKGISVLYAVKREDYRKENGEIGYKFNLLHFFDVKTRKTFREKFEQKEALIINHEIVDKRLEQGSTPPPLKDQDFFGAPTVDSSVLNNNFDQELPF